MCKFFVAAFLLFTLVPFSTARGDFVLRFQDTDFEKHGTGSVDVLFRSSESTTLFGFAALFEISSETSGGVLEFQLSQSSSERTFTSPSYNYLFLNKLSPNGFAADRQANKRQISVGDFASQDVSIAANTDYLLARLELQHVAPIGVANGAFRIRLVNEPGINSFFADSQLNLQAINPASFSNSGTISVIAVPEPSSIVMAGIVVLGATFSRLRRTKKRQVTGR